MLTKIPRSPDWSFLHRCFLLGEFNFDGSVGMDDFMMLAENYGTNFSQGDFDFKGTVELALPL